ncbi:hypothetical protein, partial [Rhizobium leguminosarum]|uniref:hypothetical protein n=1 Tax=Rhizobium leguminosarum TaxID=384 RepID=UPI003F9C2B4E
MVKASGEITPVRIHMVNSGEVSVSRIETPDLASLSITSASARGMFCTTMPMLMLRSCSP